MSSLLDIRTKLQETNAAIAKLQESVAADPTDIALGLMLTSLERRQKSLESAFLRYADLEQIDVCSYRLIRDKEDEFPIGALGETLKNFQSWLTNVYAAIKTGAKRSARVAGDIAQQSTLNFAYSYPGSLGFVFTIASERLLVGESDLDKAVDVMFRMLQARSSEELSTYAKNYGVPPIRRMYEWAENHVRFAISADIQWQRKDVLRNRIILQVPEAALLCNLIEAASDVQAEEVSVVGQLVGADVITQKFHIRVPQGGDIEGSLGESFNVSEELVLNRSYSAEIVKRTTIYYATEKELTTYELVRLIKKDGD